MVLKLDRRYSAGLTLNWNYTFSKLLTDSDSYFANEGWRMDHYNRGLEKSIGRFDQTHDLKFSTLYELPFGKGKQWVTERLPQPCHRRLAHQRDSDLLERYADRV